MTVNEVLRRIAAHPFRMLLVRWNWKTAGLSSGFRGLVFLAANFSEGWNAASGAMVAEFLYRAATAGFFGSLIQAFCRVTPRWQAALATSLLIPLVNHSLEFVVHWIRGTPNLAFSVAASTCFSLVSTQFHLHAMRNGVFVVGSGGTTLSRDLRKVPWLLWTFVTAISNFVGRQASSTCRS